MPLPLAERTLNRLSGLMPSSTPRRSADEPRLIAMIEGYKLVVREELVPNPAIVAWNDESIECITNLMTTGSSFITYLYAPYEQLEQFVHMGDNAAWSKGGIGTIHVYGGTEDGRVRHSANKLSDELGQVHLLSHNHLESFGPKPRPWVPLNGALRQHKMWTDAFADIGKLVLLGETITHSNLINARDLPKIARGGFSSLLFDQFVTVRDTWPAEPHLKDPEVHIFTEDR